MLSYEPLRVTLKNKNRKRIDLLNILSSSTVAKLAHNQAVSLSTIESICRYLDCSIEEIVIYVKTDE